MHYIYK